MKELKNKIFIDIDAVNKNKVIYKYKITGPWNEAFNKTETYYIEYSIDISNVPKSVLIIPLIANILPIAWIYDAEINSPFCDKDFFDSIKDFKNGYSNMYPMLSFKGDLKVDSIEQNDEQNKNGAAAFFSGGVDAFNTLVCHRNENISLITLWGSDISLNDVEGWNNVLNHLRQTANKFGINYITVKTSFRKFINEQILTQKVRESGDGWWHGFQHGIGIISHAAPIMYAEKKKIVYIASSFTADVRGKVTCASDPTIDNQVRFCGSQVYHDGYEYNRQMKIHNIVNYCNNTSDKLSLRVCWESDGGGNCCNCEKCWRTILGLYAEGCNPNEFGFNYSNKHLMSLAIKMKYGNNQLFSELRYKPIQDAMRKNVKKDKLPRSIRWFYDIDISKINEKHSWYIFLLSVKQRISTIWKA